MEKSDLINFENTVIKEWEKGATYGPVHLSGGNEEQLIKIFKNIKREDWVFTNHRSHYHALLKSNNPEWLINEIIVRAHSSHINSSKYKIFSSAIVGGNIPIALGVALSIKLKKKKSHVWCFIGDMASEMGIYYESLKYADNFDLPITFIVEDNSLSCETCTDKVWGKRTKLYSNKQIIYYYKRKYPHCGTGKWLKFNNNFKSTGNYDAYK